jgi:hypothetical protein
MLEGENTRCWPLRGDGELLGKDPGKPDEGANVFMLKMGCAGPEACIKLKEEGGTVGDVEADAMAERGSREPDC